ncbi:thioredoxin-like protein [Pluteus cervinus]|uniref:Thioredoxin-like protein n=1 Tax=Pluteus cervinus TaxID=181527 RepID=A0ACD3BDT0_9AGAR|nr:thioredoxin-like protein [Pluteus cervinus]
MSSSRHINSLAARLIDPNPRSGTQTDEDEDAIFAELEAEIENDDSEAMREEGMKILQRQAEAMRKLKESQHGHYSELFDEKEAMQICAKEPRCVVHFYHKDFKRCEIVDKHLSSLAPKYFNTRFFRVLAENVPWLVQKLSIKVLPCVVSFVDGISKDRLVGFEELGNSDTFETAVLELRLLSCGVIQKAARQTLGDMVYNVKSSDNTDEVFDLDD